MANELARYHTVHIVGIGGAGMSAIARVLRGRGFRVQGSDRRLSPLTEALEAEGIPVFIGHAPENVGQADLVLASSAIPDGNPELLAARERNLRRMRRPEILPYLTEGYDVIAVAGAHGKTTVTGMIALMLLDAGLDPTLIVGGVMNDLETNARAGAAPRTEDEVPPVTPYFVIEADEYRNTFLSLTPTVAVITNVDYDHPDCFDSPRFVRLAFGDFVDNVEPRGLLVACNDDEVAHAVAASFHANGGRLALYGKNEGVGLAWRATDIHPNDRGGVSFTAVRGRVPVGEIHLQIPGTYNAVNALAALTVASELEIGWESAKASLERFSGTARRFDLLGEFGGVTVIDDYAHHPTQIRAVLEAARERYPGRRIVAAWEPHTFSRILALRDDFKVAFADADRVVVLPIYAARETGDGTLHSRKLAGEMDHPQASAVETLDEAVDELAALVEPGDVVIMMGAGNEHVVGRRLLEVLAKR